MHGFLKKYSNKFNLSRFSIISVCGFNNALVVSKMNDDYIVYVEDYVRTNLPTFLQKLFDEDTTHYPIFFGSWASDPKSFELSRGEVKLIQQIILSVQNSIADDGLQVFKSTKIKHAATVMNHKLCDTPLGPFFKNQSNTPNAGISQINIAKHRTDLLAKVKKTIEKYEKPEAKPEITEADINVWTDNGVDIKGSVVCRLCDADLPTKKIKVFFQRSPCSGYWILSNLSSHLQTCHSNVDNDNEIQPEKNGTLLSLKIEPIIQAKRTEGEAAEEIDAFEDEVCTQMFTQTIKMINTSMTSKERFHIFIQKKHSETNTVQTIKVCKMKPDGNCLYAALAHQIFHDKIDSNEHKLHTQELRSNVVDFIKQHFESFVHHLKGRVYDGGKTNKDITDVNKECLSFLEEELAKEGGSKSHWGGTESIIAISQIHKVNIIIINQDGTCNTVGSFCPSHKKVLLIAFGSVNHRQSKQMLDHYDSIAHISDNLISELAKNFVSGSRKSQSLKKLSEQEADIIVIDC